MDDTPQTPEGLQSHLDYWLYGLVKVTQSLGNSRSFLRALQESTLERFRDDETLEFTQDMDPAEILQRYNQRLDERGILDADDVAYHRMDRALTVTIGPLCPYRTACTWLKEDGIPPPCFRAVAMGEQLRLVTHCAFDAKLTRFGLPCHLAFKPGPLEEVDDGD